MSNNSECIICFSDISMNDYLELDCCKQIVHIECLNKWIQSNIKNNRRLRTKKTKKKYRNLRKKVKKKQQSKNEKKLKQKKKNRNKKEPSKRKPKNKH